ncbi:hypothetical protein EK21DRAFT_85785 [Setomelanomma holmii]|uniref:Uncharacterized protein n=1 Tax=Setomelanomma holmii TaxID=210430 RepID=A0A9P4HGS6_9PLEO|nr:hypothetical protein EK21DRAFT_85785 [Setomelanomma holmii]
MTPPVQLHGLCSISRLSTSKASASRPPSSQRTLDGQASLSAPHSPNQISHTATPRLSKAQAFINDKIEFGEVEKLIDGISDIQSDELNELLKCANNASRAVNGHIDEGQELNNELREAHFAINNQTSAGKKWGMRGMEDDLKDTDCTQQRMPEGHRRDYCSPVKHREHERGCQKTVRDMVGAKKTVADMLGYMLVTDVRRRAAVCEAWSLHCLEYDL